MSYYSCSNSFWVPLIVVIIMNQHQPTSCKSRIFIPKCCDDGEILLSPKWQCQRAKGLVKVKPWTPPIFEGSEPANRDMQLNEKSIEILFRTANISQSCIGMSADNASYTGPFLNWFFTSAVTIQDTTYPVNHIKLIQLHGGESDTVQPLIFYRAKRKWESIDNLTEVCMEPIYTELYQDASLTYTVNHDNFVLAVCPDPKKAKLEAEFNTITIVDLYSIVVPVVSSLFLLAITFVYGLLWKEQNSHGMTVLSFSGVTGLLCLVTAAIPFVLFSSNEKALHGVENLGPSCYILGVFYHYLILSTWLWLIVMNFNMWRIFGSVHLVRKESDKWRKYTLQSLVGWALPLGLVLVFVIIDQIYADEVTEVSLPAYATHWCYLSPFSRNEYEMLPKLIIIVINIILTGLTTKIFVQARQRNASMFSSSHQNHYSAKFFTKIFVVMGIGWSTLSLAFLLLWYFLDGKISRLVNEVHNTLHLGLYITFSVLCLNRRVIDQLLEKYPKLAAVLKQYNDNVLKEPQTETGNSSSKLDDASSPPLDTEGLPLREKIK